MFRSGAVNTAGSPFVRTMIDKRLAEIWEPEEFFSRILRPSVVVVQLA